MPSAPLLMRSSSVVRKSLWVDLFPAFLVRKMIALSSKRYESSRSNVRTRLSESFGPSRGARIPNSHLDYVPPIEVAQVPDAVHGWALPIHRGRENFRQTANPHCGGLCSCRRLTVVFRLSGWRITHVFDALSMSILIRRFLNVLGCGAIPKWDGLDPISGGAISIGASCVC